MWCDVFLQQKGVQVSTLETETWSRLASYFGLLSNTLDTEICNTQTQITQ